MVKRKRNSIDPDISFLCTRVTKITVEDKAKLKRALQILKQTINDKRVRGTGNLIQLYTWVDKEYGVHPDLKIHTGGDM